jgi:hypothetical protein
MARSSSRAATKTAAPALRHGPGGAWALSAAATSAACCTPPSAASRRSSRRSAQSTTCASSLSSAAAAAAAVSGVAEPSTMGSGAPCSSERAAAHAARHAGASSASHADRNTSGDANAGNCSAGQVAALLPYPAALSAWRSAGGGRCGGSRGAVGSAAARYSWRHNNGLNAGFSGRAR